jgi:hypothetical protein
LIGEFIWDIRYCQLQAEEAICLCKSGKLDRICCLFGTKMSYLERKGTKDLIGMSYDDKSDLYYGKNYEH